MTKHKIVQDTGYGLIPKAITRSTHISIQAKAVYAYLAGFAGTTGRAFPSADLITYELGISRNTFYKYLKELREIGAVEVKKERSENGTFDRNVYILRNQINPHTKEEDVEQPCTKKPDTVKPDTVKPDTVKPDTVNVDTINNNLINNNLINNNLKNNNEIIKQQQSCSTTTKPEPQLKFGEESIEINIARQMIDMMLEVKPDSKVPNQAAKDLQRWAQDIDYLIRIDNRNPMDIIRVFQWTQRNDFWVANIRSPRKLREKWDTLELQMQRDKPKKSQNQNLYNLAEMYKRAAEEEEGGLF